MRIFQRHPFPVVAHFDRVVAVSFAFRADVLAPLVPTGLEMDDYEGYGFVTVAMVWTRNLRPAGMPVFLGREFFLAGYRIFTRLRGEDGRRLRGLRILRSDTDKRSMVHLGNLMTGYRYRMVDATVGEGDGRTHVKTTLPDGEVTLDLEFESGADIPLPEESPFPDWRTARRFAGPMPFTFSPRGDGSFVVVEGSRNTWTPEPVRIVGWKIGMFDEAPFSGHRPLLANAFSVCGIGYRWEKGKIIRPSGEER